LPRSESRSLLWQVDTRPLAHPLSFGGSHVAKPLDLLIREITFQAPARHRPALLRYRLNEPSPNFQGPLRRFVEPLAQLGILGGVAVEALVGDEGQGDFVLGAENWDGRAPIGRHTQCLRHLFPDGRGGRTFWNDEVPEHVSVDVLRHSRGHLQGGASHLEAHAGLSRVNAPRSLHPLPPIGHSLSGRSGLLFQKPQHILYTLLESLCLLRRLLGTIGRHRSRGGVGRERRGPRSRSRQEAGRLRGLGRFLESHRHLRPHPGRDVLRHHVGIFLQRRIIPTRPLGDFRLRHGDNRVHRALQATRRFGSLPHLFRGAATSFFLGPPLCFEPFPVAIGVLVQVPFGHLSAPPHVGIAPTPVASWLILHVLALPPGWRVGPGRHGLLHLRGSKEAGQPIAPHVVQGNRLP